jgi:hypothetical protein
MQKRLASLCRKPIKLFKDGLYSRLQMLPYPEQVVDAANPALVLSAAIT